MEAASGINSCADDMALWLNYCVKHSSDFAEALKPHVIMNAKNQLPETELPTFEIISHGQPQMHYAMGWWLYNLENNTVYRHTGSSPGMQSVLAIVPEKELGVVILSNQSKHPAVSALMNQLLDALLNRPEIDWQQEGLSAFFEAEKNKKEWLEKCLQTRKEDIPPSLPLEKYAGIYTHLGYGSIRIKENNQELDIELIFCDENGHLKHWEGNQFEIINTPSGSLEPFLCEFIMTQDDQRITGLKIKDMCVFERCEATF